MSDQVDAMRYARITALEAEVEHLRARLVRAVMGERGSHQLAIKIVKPDPPLEHMDLPEHKMFTTTFKPGDPFHIVVVHSLDGRSRTTPDLEDIARAFRAAGMNNGNIIELHPGEDLEVWTVELPE